MHRVSATLEQRLEWFSTLRARLGAVVDPDTLGYFTGGLALGRIKTSGTLSGSNLVLTPAVDNAGNPLLDVNGNPIILSTVTPVANLIEAWTTKVRTAQSRALNATGAPIFGAAIIVQPSADCKRRETAVPRILP